MLYGGLFISFPMAMIMRRDLMVKTFFIKIIMVNVTFDLYMDLNLSLTLDWTLDWTLDLSSDLILDLTWI